MRWPVDSDDGGDPGMRPIMMVALARNVRPRFARDHIDRRPVRAVVTDQLFPPPEPGRPMPGCAVAEIMAWNARSR